jgi:hypothetical protein
MNLKEAKIQELQAQHGLPAEILGRCVSDDGIVDGDKLGIALQSATFGISARSAAKQAEIEALQNAYKNLQDEIKNPQANKPDLVGRMVSIKGRLQALGAVIQY